MAGSFSKVSSRQSYEYNTCINPNLEGTTGTPASFLSIDKDAIKKERKRTVLEQQIWKEKELMHKKHNINNPAKRGLHLLKYSNMLC